MAYDRKDNKSQCSSCLLFFDRKSVQYKVPNYRIIEMRRSANVLQGIQFCIVIKLVFDNFFIEGKRYDSPSFKYFMARVCLFCSQFFDDYGISDGKDDMEVLILPTQGTDNVNYTSTDLNRKNIAADGRAYQSSTVDNAYADYALQESVVSRTDTFHEYTNITYAKTRREKNPYWEVCLGTPMNIRCVKVSVSAGNAKNTYLTIAVLPEAMEGQRVSVEQLRQMAVASKTFRLIDFSPAKKVVGTKVLLCTFQDVFWTLPKHGTGSAVRILLHGKHSLQLYNFEAYQGDEIVANGLLLPTPKRSVLFSPTSNSDAPHDSRFAPDSPSMPLIENRRFFNDSKSPSADVSFILSSDLNLVWRKRIKDAIGRFEREDFEALLRCVFNHIVRDECGDSDLIPTEGCLGETILTRNSPRIPFNTVINRLQLVFTWAQQRDLDKQKDLQSLWNRRWFHEMSVRYADTLREVVEDQNVIVHRYADSRKRPSGGGQGIDYTSCCWAQFIVLLELLHLGLPGKDRLPSLHTITIIPQIYLLLRCFSCLQ